MAHVDPFPLVPATCTKRQARCGLPNAPNSLVIRSRSNLDVGISLPSEYKKRTASAYSIRLLSRAGWLSGMFRMVAAEGCGDAPAFVHFLESGAGVVVDLRRH